QRISGFVHGLHEKGTQAIGTVWLSRSHHLEKRRMKPIFTEKLHHQILGNRAVLCSDRYGSKQAGILWVPADEGANPPPQKGECRLFALVLDAHKRTAQFDGWIQFLEKLVLQLEQGRGV